MIERLTRTQARNIFYGGSLGGLKWSSQRLKGGGCDEEAQAAFGSVWSGAIDVTRSTVCGRTR
jgi:hypothetical protein